MNDQQRRLNRVAQFDQLARQPAATVETLHFLAQLEQDPACVNIIELDIRDGEVERAYLRAVNIAAYDLVRDGQHLMVMEKIHRNYAAGRSARARPVQDAEVSDAVAE